MPPATTSSASPARISAAASMIALRPEPQTRLIVVALVVSGEARLERGLASRRLADAGLQDLAHEDLVDRGRRRAGPARSTAARIATPPSSTAGVPARAPPNLPIGVRAALTRKTSAVAAVELVGHGPNLHR